MSYLSLNRCSRLDFFIVYSVQHNLIDLAFSGMELMALTNHIESASFPLIYATSTFCNLTLVQS